jgi:L-fuculose-phosphate aldolase
MKDYQNVPLMMRMVYERGLTTLSGGNLSMRVSDEIWITPSGIDKGNLTRDDVVCIKADATHIGKHRPSSEYPFHQAIYAVRDDVQVILHAHSPALVAYCIAHKVPDTRLIKEVYAICGEIGYADYVMPGSPQHGEKLAGVFAQGYDVLLMENNGVVVVGQSLELAFQRLETAALLAQVTLHAVSLGDTIKLNFVKREKFNQHVSDIVSMETEIEDFRQRGIYRGLFLTATTQFSTQIRNDNPLFLIEAQPAHLMAFAVTHTPLDTRTIPEAYVTLHDVPLLEDDENAISEVLAKYDALIVKNSRVIVAGKTILEAYDRLEVLEYTARSAIEAARIGGLVPMSQQAIHDLDENYHQYYKGLSG